MDEQARRFRLAARRHQQGKAGPGIRYPKELHHEAVCYARTRQQKGHSLLAISRDLGVKPITLSRWLQETPGSPLRRIEVLSSDSPSLESGSAMQVTVTVPGGIRIEGLDLESLIVLLRRLA